MPHRPEHGEDAWGRPLARPKTLDESERLEALPRGGEDELRWWRCSMCGRLLEAVPDCAICGDHEDMIEEAA